MYTGKLLYKVSGLFSEMMSTTFWKSKDEFFGKISEAFYTGRIN
jgi:hypothetical protein